MGEDDRLHPVAGAFGPLPASRSPIEVFVSKTFLHFSLGMAMMSVCGYLRTKGQWGLELIITFP